MKRSIKRVINGFPTQDGAGVKLVRVLGHGTVQDFDPILMLDSFDATDYEAYRRGFPLHPHRGIETISYVYKGAMTHRDSLGNEDTISDGEVQWMTAGSGIMHEEMMPESERLLGVQLWLNLPQKDKMCPPKYVSVKNKEIPEVPFEGGYLRVLTGSYEETEGFTPSYLPLDYYDIHLEENASFTFEVDPQNTAILFTLDGEMEVNEEHVDAKSAVLLTEGDTITISSKKGAQVLFLSSTALKEPVRWGGPIVMNTNEELKQAFLELEQGTFLKETIAY
ncbi:pirin family protein [Guggenheimella bovis]